MSLQQVPRSDYHGKGGPRSDVQGVTLPDLSGRELSHHVTYPMMDLMSPPHEQTNACENITFPQRYLRAVKTHEEKTLLFENRNVASHAPVTLSLKQGLPVQSLHTFMRISMCLIKLLLVCFSLITFNKA